MEVNPSNDPPYAPFLYISIKISEAPPPVPDTVNVTVVTPETIAS